MALFKRLILEAHRRSVWQVLAIYILGAAAGYQVVQSLTEGLGLPEWFPGMAVVMFIVLLPVVLAAAIVREEHPQATERPPRPEPEPGPAPEPGGEPEPAPAEPRRGRRVLTWQRALLGLVGIFALWGVVAFGWVIFGGGLPTSQDTDLAGLRTKLLVLPFENLGPPEDEYFADGVTEEINSRLAEIPELGVISRTSALQYKGTDLTIAQLGAELDVEYVLEGTVRWERGDPGGGASRVRVTPQLIRVSDDTNIWSQRYDAVLSDIFAVQSDIAENVASALDIALAAPQRQSIQQRPTDDLAAYDFFLRGHDFYARRFNEPDARAAVDMYQRAVGLDPSFAHAHAALARARVWLYHQFGRSSELMRARTAVEDAISLAPDLAEAHMALGDYHYYGRSDYERALEEYVTVQRRQPANAEAIALIAWIQRRMGEWEKSVANAERAFELDPRNTVTAIGQAQTLFYLGRFAEAEIYCQRAIAVAPDVAYYYRWTIWLYLAWDGDMERARRTIRDASRRLPTGDLLVGGEASWVVVDVFGPELAGALDLLSLSDPGVDSAYYYLAHAQIGRRLGQAGRARAYFDSAVAVLEERAADEPGQASAHSALGLAYAGLGRAEEAIREARRGAELVPISRDAVTGHDHARDLARVYVMAGEYEAAVEQLEIIMSVPSPITPALLRVDPFWAPLRARPDFQRLIGEGASPPPTSGENAVSRTT